MAKVVLRDLTKVFPGGTVAVDHVDLTIDDGEFVVLVGPSGCGKSTLLRMVAGLEDVTDGTVEIDGEVVNFRPPKDRDVAMVFQNYALYPHLSVEQNMGFSLKIRHVPKREAREQVHDTAHVLGMEALLARKPAALSGGQRQRVAMGRALVRQPRLFLMDEPLSNLDAKLRVAMRGELIRLHQRYRTTTIYVTHDQVEAMTLGDRIAVLDRGRLQQVGTPEQLYQSPCNVFVAGFIGSPAMNLARGRLIDAGGAVTLATNGYRWRVPTERVTPLLAGAVGREVVFGLRPDAFRLVAGPARDAGGDAGAARLPVTAVTVESLGNEKNVLFVPPFDQSPIDGERPDSEPPPLWTARLAPTVHVRAGDQVMLDLDLLAAYFFDAADGTAIPSAPTEPGAVPAPPQPEPAQPEPAPA